MTQTQINTVIEALTEAEDYFDNRSDVVDGDYGIPEPNTEMRLLQIVHEALELMEKAK